MYYTNEAPRNVVAEQYSTQPAAAQNRQKKTIIIAKWFFFRPPVSYRST